MEWAVRGFDNSDKLALKEGYSHCSYSTADISFTHKDCWINEKYTSRKMPLESPKAGRPLMQLAFRYLLPPDMDIAYGHHD